MIMLPAEILSLMNKSLLGIAIGLWPAGGIIHTKTKGNSIKKELKTRSNIKRRDKDKQQLT